MNLYRSECAYTYIKTNTMKKLLLLIIICIPGLVNAQILKYSRAYVGGILQDGRPGGNLVLSYGINKYLGIGAGVDLLSYKPEGQKQGKFFAPFYADLRIKYPVNNIEPFVIGQFGKPAYENELKGYRDMTLEAIDLKLTGKHFFGVGGGIMFKQPQHLGVFVSAVYRKYYFNYDPDHFDINGRIYKFDALNKGMVMFSIGLVF
jgi:hypothetical protein